MRQALPFILFGLLLTGCEQLGIEDPAKLEAAREAEGRAIGSACRHSGRALEECYSLNKKASKAAIFSGWRDMDAYMRENNIDIIPPAGKRPAAPVPAPAPAEAGKTGAEAAKPGAAAASGRKAV
ncbi:MAG: hypothetical protein RBS28_06175 [Rhodocyclaceae bacterium]|jgi:hypothetical protein|nr:hypothetical protein [Rhodocyclaceae bacterium]